MGKKHTVTGHFIKYNSIYSSSAIAGFCPPKFFVAKILKTFLTDFGLY